MEPNNQEPQAAAVYLWVLSLSVGLAIGAGIGVVIGHIGAGIAVGVGVGVAVGLFLYRRSTTNSSDD
jgi:F0F1-type ATP synthase membrane subunit c/vacuolar-type H+-ATPase subunit K